MPTTDPPKPKRIRELDGLRGIAAFLVVIYHYTNGYEWFYGHPNLQDYPLFASYIDLKLLLGKYGVQVFFVISGFVILTTLQKTTRSIDFIFNRLSRLYPVYWIAILLTCLAIAIFKLPLEDGIVPIEFAVNLTMLQDFFHIPSIDPVYWTLKVELCFYLVMLSIWKLRLLRWIDYVSIAWLTVILLEKRHIIKSLLLGQGITFSYRPELAFSFSDFNSVVIYLKDILKYDVVLLNGWDANHAYLFIAGILIYRIYKQGWNWIRLGGVLACLLIQVMTPFAGESLFVNTIFVTALCGAIYGSTQGYLTFLTWKPLVFLGGISYSLYLTHQMIGYAILHWMYQFILNPYVNILITLPISLLLATLLAFYVEKPSLAFLRSWYQKKFKPTFLEKNCRELK